VLGELIPAALDSLSARYAEARHPHVA